MTSETMINEIMVFHEASGNYEVHKDWFDSLYKILGGPKIANVGLALQKIAPEKLRHIYNSLPNHR